MRHFAQDRLRSGRPEDLECRAESRKKAKGSNRYLERKKCTNLFDSDCWLPGLLLVEDRKTDGSRRVDVWMKQRGGEFTYTPYTHIQVNVGYNYAYISGVWMDSLLRMVSI